VARDRWTTPLVATGYATGVAVLVWGLPAGELLVILLGLVLIAQPAA
jgi:hypothetical protein